MPPPKAPLLLHVLPLTVLLVSVSLPLRLEMPPPLPWPLLHVLRLTVLLVSVSGPVLKMPPPPGGRVAADRVGGQGQGAGVIVDAAAIGRGRVAPHCAVGQRQLTGAVDAAAQSSRPC